MREVISRTESSWAALSEDRLTDSIGPTSGIQSSRQYFEELRLRCRSKGIGILLIYNLMYVNDVWCISVGLIIYSVYESINKQAPQCTSSSVPLVCIIERSLYSSIDIY